MTRTFKRAAFGVAAALLTVGVYAAAQDQNTNQTPPPFRGGRGAGRGAPWDQGRPSGGPMGLLPPLGPELQLTDAQREQIRTIAETHRDEWKTLADRGRAAHQALMAAVAADEVNESAIRAKSAEVAAVEADAAVARAHARAEVLQILTADQKSTLKDLQAKRATRQPSGGRGRH
jgi:Spy/CpxP family protein refolding chaperone